MRLRYLIYFMLFLWLIIIFFLFSGIFSPEKDFSCKDCNVLFITFDSLRFDHLGAYGYVRNTSPNIDSLASKGLVFDNFIVNAPLTFLSLPMIMASKLNYQELNLPSGETDYAYILSDEITLSKFLSNRGYNSFALTNHEAIDLNMFRGFDSYINFPSKKDSSLTPEIINFINSSAKIQGSKFFVWAHYFSPHGPLMPVFPFNETFYKDEFYSNNYGTLSKLNKTISDGDVFKLSQYDGEILQADYEVGLIFSFLNEKKLLNNTLIIFSTDHGENLLEHEYHFTHGVGYDTELKAPLIIFNPKSKIKSRRFIKQVQAIDIYPTIADILGFKINHSIDGFSFYNLIIGKKYTERIAFSIIPDPNSYALHSRLWKFMNFRGDKRLFNLKEDPYEQNNIYPFLKYIVLDSDLEKILNLSQVS